MRTLEKLKIVQEFMYQRNHHKMKKQIKKNLRKLERQWELR